MKIFIANTGKFLQKIPKWLWLVLGVTAVLRLPSLFEPHRYADEDIYFTLGMAMRRGLNFYKDIHDNKPPLIYFLAGLAGSIFWLRLILLLWHAVNIFFVYLLAKEILGKKNQNLIIFATALFSFLTTIPAFEGNIANGEIFMIMPATIGAYLLWKNCRKTRRLVFFWTGALFAIAFLFKVPIIFDLVGIMLFVWIFNNDSWKKRLKFLTQPAFWLTLAGFLLPIALTTFYYWTIGAFKPFFYSALFQNIGYLSSWEGAGQPLWQGGLFQRGVILSAIIAFLFIVKKHLRKETLFIALWFAFSLFGALLSGRPYAHYLIEASVPFALLVSLIFSSKKALEKVILAVVGCLAFISFFYYRFWSYKNLPYYQNFVSFVLGRKSQQEYFDFFGSVTRNYQVAYFIKERTVKNDKIFVWGTQPAIYVVSKRLPVGRYTVSYHVADFNAWDETINGLIQKKPEFIVKMLDEEKDFGRLDSLLASDYISVKTIEEAEIWKRIK